MGRAQPRKEILLETAYELFNKHGYHQTGIDMIMAESGVSKTTMYKYFRTKEELVLAILQRRSEALLETMKSRVHAVREDNPDANAVQTIGAILDHTELWINGEAFAGCNFIRAATEYCGEDEIIVACARDHKDSVKSLIKSCLGDIPSRNRDAVAEQIMVIFDGAIVASHTRARTDSVKHARMLIALTIENACARAA